MPMTRAATPAVKSAGGTRVRAKTAVAGRPPRKNAASRAAKKARVVKKSAQAIKREAEERRRAAVEARQRTKAATNRIVGAEPVAVDPDDDVARAAIDKRQVRGRRTAVQRAADPPPGAGAALVERVTRAVERELSQIELIVGGSHVNRTQRTEAERRARTLASLARTLTEVRRLRAEEDRLKPADDNARSRNTPEFRLELARRLDRLVAEAKAVHPDER
ncbi:hypothetical protein [uncultured Bradyrhizobium sp.]|uniref:hypothetical protein n=1 Tax=uncultured Bradyrhizobium sp. TaxID=199684 RepID=UPI0035CBDC97